MTIYIFIVFIQLYFYILNKGNIKLVLISFT